MKDEDNVITIQRIEYIIELSCNFKLGHLTTQMSIVVVSVTSWYSKVKLLVIILGGWLLLFCLRL